MFHQGRVHRGGNLMDLEIRMHPTLGIMVRNDGAVFNHLSGGSTKTRLTYGGVRKDGYHRVTVNKKEYLVHRLVAETFLIPVEGKPFVDHINRNKSDNRVENLRYVNSFENNENGSAADRVDYGVREFEDKKAYSKARYVAIKADPTRYALYLEKHRKWVIANKEHLAEYARKRRAAKCAREC